MSTVGSPRPTILLFDIDGTLIDSAGAGRRALERALAVHGAPTESAGFSFAGMTDCAIVRRALAASGQAPTEGVIAAVLASYLGFLAEEVARTSDEDYRIHPGITEALTSAAAQPACALGLGTGNIERGAEVKLGRVGLADRFVFGGYGSDAEDRAELLAIGAARGAAWLGCASLRDCRVVVVGDTPRDVAAAHAIGAECLAVATGPISATEIALARPDWLFESLAEPGALGALLGRRD